MKKIILILALFLIAAITVPLASAMSTVEVITPNGGESYGYGGDETPTVGINYYTPTPVISGYTLKVFACSTESPYSGNCWKIEQYNITAGGSATHWFDWNVTNEPASNKYKIKAQIWYEGEVDSSDKSNAVFTVRAGKVAYWKFDEATGNIVHDHSLETNQATFKGGNHSYWTNGVFHSGAGFDDDPSGYMEVENDESLGNRESFTIEVFVRTEGLEQSRPVYFGQLKQDINTSEHLAYGLVVDGSSTAGKDTFGICLYDGSWPNCATQTINDLSEWTSLVVAFDGDSHWMYLNGDKTGTGSLWPTEISGTGQFVLALGKSAYNDSGLDGAIDKIVVYDRPLMESQLLYNDYPLQEKINAELEIITEPDISIRENNNRIWTAYEEAGNIYARYRDHNGWSERYAIFNEPTLNESTAQVLTDNGVLAFGAVVTNGNSSEIRLKTYPDFPPFIPFRSDTVYATFNEISELNMHFIGGEYVFVWREYDPVGGASEIKFKHAPVPMIEPVYWSQTISAACPLANNRLPSTCVDGDELTVIWSCRWSPTTEQYSLYENVRDPQIGWLGGQEVRREPGNYTIEDSDCVRDDSGMLWAVWKRDTYNYPHDRDIFIGNVEEQNPYIEFVAGLNAYTPKITPGVDGKLWLVWSAWQAYEFNYDIEVEWFKPVNQSWGGVVRYGTDTDDILPVLSDEPFFDEPILFWTRNAVNEWYTTIPQ